MLKLVLALGALAAGGYFLPQVYEGTGNACAALETKAIRAIAVQDANAGEALRIAARFSDGELGRAAAAQEYPNLPGGLACVAGWYDMDSSEIRF